MIKRTYNKDSTKGKLITTFIKKNNIPKQEAYAILQLKKEKKENLLFLSYKQVTKKQKKINLDDYDILGTYPINKTYPDDIKELHNPAEKYIPLLEHIFKIWNIYDLRPDTYFKGHSLSISDIVSIYKNNKLYFFYCDPIGFELLHDETEDIF